MPTEHFNKARPTTEYTFVLQVLYPNALLRATLISVLIHSSSIWSVLSAHSPLSVLNPPLNRCRPNFVPAVGILLLRFWSFVVLCGPFWSFLVLF